MSFRLGYLCTSIIQRRVREIEQLGEMERNIKRELKGKEKNEEK